MDKCNVKSILGISEQDLVKIPRQIRTKMYIGEPSSASSSAPRSALLPAGRRVFVHPKTGKETPFGSFESVTISELCRRVNEMQSTTDAKTKKTPPTLTTASRVDIGHLQGTLTTDDRALVQVASNFNCLENGSISRGPDCGFLVDLACRDYTQGPAAVFPTLSAYLFRAHFFPQEINLLKDAADYFGVPRNGKLLLGGGEKAIVDTGGNDNSNNLLMEEVVKAISIGLHKDCPILFARDSKGNVYETSNHPDDDGDEDASCEGCAYPTVDHVLTASVNYNRVGVLSQDCRASVVGHSEEEKERAYMDRMARVLLRAAYEGTYLAAILQGRKTLLLTLVGGGSFGNPVSIIVEEMKRAHEKWAGHPASRLEKCQVCLFSEKDEAEVKKHFLSASGSFPQHHV